MIYLIIFLLFLIYFKLYFHLEPNFLILDSIFIFIFLLFILFYNIDKKIKIIIVGIILTLFSFQIEFILGLVKVRPVQEIFTRNFRLIENFTELPKTPSILVLNYSQDKMETLVFKLIPVKCVPIMAGWSSIKNIIENYTGNVIFRPYNKRENMFNTIKTEIQKYIEKKFYIFTYISIPSKHFGLSKLRSGIFRIAKDLNVPITPICVDYIQNNFGYIPYQNFRIKVGETFYIQDIQQSMNRTRNFYKKNLTEFIKNKQVYFPTDIHT